METITTVAIGDKWIEFVELQEEQKDAVVETHFEDVKQGAKNYVAEGHAVVVHVIEMALVTAFIAYGTLQLYLVNSDFFLFMLVVFGYGLGNTAITFLCMRKHRALHRLALAFIDFANGVTAADQSDPRIPFAKRMSLTIHGIAYEEAVKCIHSTEVKGAKS